MNDEWEEFGKALENFRVVVLEELEPYLLPIIKLLEKGINYVKGTFAYTFICSCIRRNHS